MPLASFLPRTVTGRLLRLRDRLHGARLEWCARHARLPRDTFAVRRVPAIVSLTTHGVRLERVHVTIETLLRQDAAAERVVLWLSDRLRDRPLPPALRRQTARGLEVRYTPDIGPYTKIIPALHEFPGRAIITVDDDSLYAPDLVGRLWAAAEAEPGLVHCHRAHYILFDGAGRLLPYWEWRKSIDDIDEADFRIFPTGVGGVVYPPGTLHPEVLREDVFRGLCPTADDVWLKAMSLLQGVRCRRIRGPHREFPLVRGTEDSGLMRANVGEGKNDGQIRAVFERYDLLPRLRERSAAV